ncbi:Fanconi anemia complementation group M [Operophtera brumata]|uniref:Fanconi anemia complementation group M n=1 Tax=Operophtera brumata TaxID=104452 RepID=A0A0L7LFC7_OPEBR|nr:Fanconi anemia complementation group M [Operophtera brumata]
MSASNNKHTSTGEDGGTFEDDEIFDDSTFLANFGNTSFKQTNVFESNVNDSLDTSALNVSALCCDEEICGYDKITGRTWIYPTNYSVSLPTGLGKTFIAAVIMYNFYRWYPLGKIVFTAPTRPLVAQQIEACYNIVAIPPNDTIEMTVWMENEEEKDNSLLRFPSLGYHTVLSYDYLLSFALMCPNKRVFFATPQVIYNDLKSGICPADKIRCLVIDEAHRARGNYAYCQIVGTLDDLGLKTYRLLALSATPGSKVEDVVRSLHIAHLELRTEACIDVARYSHARKINTILDHYARRLKMFNILPHNLGNLSKGRIVMIVGRSSRRKCSSGRAPRQLRVMRNFREGACNALVATCVAEEGLDVGSVDLILCFDISTRSPIRLVQSHYNALVATCVAEEGLDVGSVDLILCFDISTRSPIRLVQSHFNALVATCVAEEGLDVGSVDLILCFDISTRSPTRLVQSHFNALVATCVAEEGLDVGSVDLILCFDISTRSPIRLVQSHFNALVATCVAEEGLDVGSVGLILCFDISTRSLIRLVQR